MVQQKQKRVYDCLIFDSFTSSSSEFNVLVSHTKVLILYYEGEFFWGRSIHYICTIVTNYH